LKALTSKAVATRIWKQREAEVALGLFKVGWPGERITFEELCEEYAKSHVSCLSESSKKAFENHRKHLLRSFGGHRLTEIDTQMIERYKNDRRQQPTRNNPERTVKGATVNPELETIQCMLKMAVRRKYIAANPASPLPARHGRGGPPQGHGPREPEVLWRSRVSHFYHGDL